MPRLCGGSGVTATFLFSCGGPARGRPVTLARDPRLVVHLESGDEVVIVEGVAEPVAATEADVEEYERKYAFQARCRRRLVPALPRSGCWPGASRTTRAAPPASIFRRGWRNSGCVARPALGRRAASVLGRPDSHRYRGSLRPCIAHRTRATSTVPPSPPGSNPHEIGRSLPPCPPRREGLMATSALEGPHCGSEGARRRARRIGLRRSSRALQRDDRQASGGDRVLRRRSGCRRCDRIRARARAPDRGAVWAATTGAGARQRRRRASSSTSRR